MSDETTPSATAERNQTPNTGYATSSLLQQVYSECSTMVHYALRKGFKLPPDLVSLLDLLNDAPSPKALKDFIKLHNRLAEIVAPATPGTIHLLDSDPKKGSLLCYFGPLPNIRYLMSASVFFIIVFICTSMTEDVNHKTLFIDLYELVGTEQLVVTIFLLSASGLGACFNALFSAYRYIGNGTYDPRYDSSYWIRIILGLIAGLVMSQLVPVEEWMGESKTADAATEAYPSFGKPLLALLGGFSASMVYTVLQRLVETIESLFKGSASHTIEQQEQTIRAKLDRQFGENRLAAASDLIALKEAVSSNAAPERVAALVNKALNNLSVNSE